MLIIHAAVAKVPTSTGFRCSPEETSQILSIDVVVTTAYSVRAGARGLNRRRMNETYIRAYCYYQKAINQ